MRRMLRRILLVFAILFIGFVSVIEQAPANEKRTVSIANEATSSAVREDSVQVTRVIDGDTIEITGGIKVRYIGVNAPELTKAQAKPACFGEEATEENKRLVSGKTVRLEKDVSDTDKYGRLLRYVYVGDIMVNDALVRNGFARVSTYPPDVRYQNRFRESEEYARNANAGLWKGCPT